MLSDRHVAKTRAKLVHRQVLLPCGSTKGSAPPGVDKSFPSEKPFPSTKAGLQNLVDPGAFNYMTERRERFPNTNTADKALSYKTTTVFHRAKILTKVQGLERSTFKNNF